jgi:hypothetical protein
MPRRAVLACLLLSIALPAPAAQPQFWKLEEARDFLEGDTEAISVDSEGRLQLAPRSRHLFDPDSPFVWALAGDGKGVLYAGTGNDGRIFKIEGDKGRLLYDAPELEVHALALGPDGRLYAGTSPDGKVYAIDASGKADTFYDPADKYIWALAFDAKGNLMVATGGEGRVHRVARDGKGTVLFTSAETHLTALTLDSAGTIYAGSAPGGVLFRVAADGRVFVVHDSPYREIKAIDVGEDGSVYAAAIESKDGSDSGRPSAPFFSTSSTSGAPSAEVTVTETFTVPSAAAPTPTASPRVSEAPRGGPSKGGVFRVLPSGEVDTLWASSEESPHSLLATPSGILVGTGNRGKLYQVRNDRTWTMITAFPAEQLTGLLRQSGGRIALATSNPAKLHEVGSEQAASGTFTSKTRDTETVSTWGRLRWEGDIPQGSAVKIETRSGNTSTPDSTWTEWASVPAQGNEAPIGNERARFLQIRATLTAGGAGSPTLDTLSAAYLQRNLRPQVQSVTVHPPGEVFQKPLSLTGETEILGLEGSLPVESRPAPAQATGGSSGRLSAPPAATTYSRKMYQKGLQTFSWKAEDQNGDALTYEVHYRAVADKRFRLLRKGMTEAVLAWDTSTVPNGRYVVRVTTSDSPGNPEGLALTGDKESVPFDVDNTPPVVTATATGGRVRVLVKDDSSLVRRAEYSVDGGRWQDVHPLDGINDATEEVYEIQPRDLAGAGPHTVTVRASDLLGNVATGRVEIP